MRRSAIWIGQPKRAKHGSRSSVYRRLLGRVLAALLPVGPDLALTPACGLHPAPLGAGKAFTPFCLSSNPYTFLPGFFYNVVLLTTITASAQLPHTALSK